MSIVRIRRRSQYVSIEHSVLSDLSLSWEAKGLHAYLLSRPDDWHVSVRHLAKSGKNAGRDKIYRMLGELLARGYAERLQIRSESGRIVAYEYIVHEHRLPLPSETEMPIASPLTEKPDTAEPDRANATRPNNKFNLAMNKPKSRRALTNCWLPSAEAFAILNAENIPREYSESIVAEFMLYWCERDKYAGAWNSRFVSFVQRRWRYEQTLQNEQKSPADTFARFFDRSWATGMVHDQNTAKALINGKDEGSA